MVITIVLIILAAILDTAFGNRYLPGKTGVSQGPVSKMYYVYKWNRYFFIPIKGYLVYGDTDRRLGNFGGNGYKFSDPKKAIQYAQIYANTIEDPTARHTEIWNSRQKPIKDPIEEDILTKLGEAIKQDNEERIIELAKLLRK